MTLPNERFRALMYGRNLLRQLADRTKTPGVPKYIRKEAFRVLRHYPSKYELEKVAENLPDDFECDQSIDAYEYDIQLPIKRRKTTKK